MVETRPAGSPIVIRDNSGRFQPGSVANPTGRPTLPPEVRRMLEAATPKAVRRLIELIDDADPKVAAACANSVLDRLFGRPTQSVDAKVEQTTSIQQAHLQALREINKRREAQLDAERCLVDAKVIDIEAEHASNKVRG